MNDQTLDINDPKEDIKLLNDEKTRGGKVMVVEH